MGESGVGKSSFLQAGILPQLAREESCDRGIYIRFSNRDPVETIYQTLVKELKISETQIDHQNLLEIFALAVASVDKPLILIFDQFEQFFVHCKQKSDREPFINSLKDWYLAPNPLPIKILISIRGDLADRMIEIQKALGYSPSPQEVFRLERFTPKEATKVLQVISQAEELKFDEGFVSQLTAEELASREDGLISPVDLQVLAWTIEGQNTKELQAFSRNAFQKIGGIEGLMTRFLNRTLEARVTESQKQAAIKVLLAMTDLDRNMRVGALTIEDLQQKMQGALTASETKEAMFWLANPGVRLLTPVQQDETELYELTHERLIPALREIAGKELNSADKANQLLDRRVNEWLGNERSSRYLFHWQELQLIRQQKPFLVWGTKKRHKKRLLQCSWRTLCQQLVAVAMLLVFSLGVISWWYSPWGQIQQVRWELEELGTQVPYKYRKKAALAFFIDANLKQTLTIANSMTDSYYKYNFLYLIAQTIGKLENFPKTSEFLELAIAATDSITDLHYKANVLYAIAQTIGKLGNFPKVAKSLNLMIAAADSLTLSDKVKVLTAIAQTIGKPENFPEVAKSLNLMIAAADSITNSYYKALVLTAIAQTYGELEDFLKSAKFLELAITTANSSYHKTDVLREVAQTIGKFENFTETAKFLELVIDTTGTITNNSHYKALVLIAIAETIGKLENFPETANFLELVLAAANSIKGSYYNYDLDYKALVLIAIAETIGKLENFPEMAKLLEQAFVDAKSINSLSNKVEALTTIAQTYSKLKNFPEASRFLERAAAYAYTITNNSHYKALFLNVIAQTYSNLKNFPEATKFLEQAFATADTIDMINDSDPKAKILAAIIPTQAKLDHWKQAYNSVSLCPTKECQVESLASILTIWAEKKNSFFIENIKLTELESIN